MHLWLQKIFFLRVLCDHAQCVGALAFFCQVIAISWDIAITQCCGRLTYVSLITVVDCWRFSDNRGSVFFFHVKIAFSKCKWREKTFHFFIISSCGPRGWSIWNQTCDGKNVVSVHKLSGFTKCMAWTNVKETGKDAMRIVWHLSVPFSTSAFATSRCTSVPRSEIYAQSKYWTGDVS